MATSLVHMVPEVRRNFDNTFQSNLTAETASDDGTCSNLAGSGQVPLAEIVLCAGFFVVFLIEELVLTFAKEEGTKDETTTTVKRTFSMRKVTKKSAAAVAAAGSPRNNNEKSKKDGDAVDSTNSDSSPPDPQNEDPHVQKRDPHSDRHEDQIQTVSTFDVLNDTASSVDGFNPKYQGRLKASTGMFPTYHPTYEEKKVQRTMRKQEMMQRLFKCCNASAAAVKDVPGLPDDVVLPECPTASTKDVLTVAALSFHAIFEGMAIGLEAHTIDVWKTFGAVAVHKFVVTFCVGMDLVNSETTNLCSYITFMVIYCLTTPMGVVIGVGVTEGPPMFDSTAVGLLQGLSAGTILYVVVFEVLQREKTKRKVPGLVQLVLIVVGFILMIAVEVTLPRYSRGTFPGSDNSSNIVPITLPTPSEEIDIDHFHPPIIEAQGNHTHN